MFAELRQYPQALMLSVLLHVGLLVVIFISLDSADEKKLIKQGEMTKTVKAQVIDSQQLEATKEKKQAEIDKKKKAQEASKKRKLEADKKKREEAGAKPMRKRKSWPKKSAKKPSQRKRPMKRKRMKPLR